MKQGIKNLNGYGAVGLLIGVVAAFAIILALALACVPFGFLYFAIIPLSLVFFGGIGNVMGRHIEMKEHDEELQASVSNSKTLSTQNSTTKGSLLFEDLTKRGEAPSAPRQFFAPKRQKKCSADSAASSHIARSFNPLETMP